MADLESHLKFLREALEALPAEPDRYKVVGSSLRVLVCHFGSNKPLLLDLLDDLEVSFLISPLPDLPFPLPMVDELDVDPEVDLTAMSPDELWAYHRSRAKSYPLREFVRRGLAVYVLGRGYSYSDLIRAVAEQSGLSHEDPTIDHEILELESFVIGGFQGHVAPLRALAEQVLSAGVLAVNHAASRGYVPHYLVQRANGEYSLPDADAA